MFPVMTKSLHKHGMRSGFGLKPVTAWVCSVFALLVYVSLGWAADHADAWIAVEAPDGGIRIEEVERQEPISTFRLTFNPDNPALVPAYVMQAAYQAAEQRGASYFVIHDMITESISNRLIQVEFAHQSDMLKVDEVVQDTGDDIISLPRVVFDVNNFRFLHTPSTTSITALLTSALNQPQSDSVLIGSQTIKEPYYIDIHPGRLILYPGEQIIPWSEAMEQLDPRLMAFLDKVEAQRDEAYIVLLVRPHSAAASRRMARLVRDRGIDLDVELFEAGRSVDYQRQK